METITIEVDAKLAHEAETILAAEGLTLEDAVVLFFRWCIANPKQAKETIKGWMKEQESKQ